jgi:hypothetical protein
MSDEKRLAAAFLLRPTTNGGTIHELLRRADATDLVDGSSDDRSGLVYCRWAGMACAGFLEEGEAQWLLVIFFSQSSFLRMLPDDPADAKEPAAELLGAFVAACESLQPDAAVIMTHPDQADIDELRSLAGLVLEADAPRLAAERFGLLYVSDKLVAYQDEPWFGPDREVASVARGLLIFAGKGGKRWW